MKKKEEELINELRLQIDGLDREISKLLSQRYTCAWSIQQLKIKRGIPLIDGKREQEIIKRIQQSHPELPPDYIANIYKQVFVHS